MDIPDQLKKQIQQLQQLQQQGEMVANQRAQVEMTTRELQQTLKELEKLSDKETLYRSIGSVMLKVKSRDDLVTELKDEQDTNELRVKSLKGQEDLLKTQLQKLQEQIQGQIASIQGQAGGGLGGALGS